MSDFHYFFAVVVARLLLWHLQLFFVVCVLKLNYKICPSDDVTAENMSTHTHTQRYTYNTIILYSLFMFVLHFQDRTPPSWPTVTKRQQILFVIVVESSAPVSPKGNLNARWILNQIILPPWQCYTTTTSRETHKERERGTHFAPESERIQYKSLAVSEQEAKQIITGAVAFAECIKIHTHTHE